ncbi:alpha/beta fold hydrolase [Pseudoalteromonas xiamenensis]|uniref:Proline iminopeptidase n=1 Tax=Pseudoalteromonas xiamenensis TaxID=882626 RepID=A0A975DGB1_9GAMM|nr:alpha/beta fold hydrolase [Pseudoalteromonas xiamenensis]QTH70700.1 alpha/beta fold hydrolase [Pseudoalteromonas xiamenensis]
MSRFYQHTEAFRQYHLAVGDGHQMSVEEWGNPTGLPVFVCHGGPGFGSCTSMVQFFNPDRYRVIFFSQRGCKGSTPHSIEHNTTQHLVHDIEMLRQHLGLEKILLAGGSWGATLALLYAITHPNAVKGLLLWATFLATESDYEWLYGADGAGAQFYPEAYSQFNPDQLKWEHLLSEYHTVLQGKDDIAAYHAAKQWLSWESLLLNAGTTFTLSLVERHQELSYAQIMLHYFTHRCFIAESEIADRAESLRAIPTWFIHGRHDLICRFSPVLSLSERMKARMLIIDGVGHSIQNSVYSEAILRAADLLQIKLDH